MVSKEDVDQLIEFSLKEAFVKLVKTADDSDV